MKKTISFILVGLVFFTFACNFSEIKQKGKKATAIWSTNLYMVKEIKQAYKNNTRSADGKPGKNYWQNQTDYKIQAIFSPTTGYLEGSEIISYKNNSPDTLQKIVIRLYQDIYKKGNARDWDIGNEDIHEGVNIKSLKIGNTNYNIKSANVKRYGTTITVKLQEKIVPHSTILVETQWNFKMPKEHPIRMGRYNKTSFLVGYWYPKIAVYDDILGWDTHSYTGQTEFYNEYGDFDVEISLPRNYLAWSSGVLQNANEIFEPAYLKKITAAATSSDVIHIITEEDWKINKITMPSQTHTWKFVAKNRTDFAFSVSNDFLWDGTSATIGNKKVAVQAVYKRDSKDFRKVAAISKDVLEYYANQMPTLVYPYPQMVAFNGGGGMEFPGMINDGDTDSDNSTLYLTGHEIGHTFFPFYVGINENRYAWMDEGLVSFFPRQYVLDRTKDTKFNPFTQIVERYNASANTFSDFPQMLASDNTKGATYRFHAYRRPSAAFYVLRDMLGNDVFNASLKEFTKRWQGKHPTPYDFFNSFNQTCNEDLSWFWKPWFFDFAYADLALGKTKLLADETEIEIIKNGEIPVLIKLNIKYKDGSEREITETAHVWKGKKTFKIKIKNKAITSLTLDSRLTPDADKTNNKLVF